MAMGELVRAEVAHVVGSNRIVTLTGVGGVGKIRLAIEVARRVETDFDAAFFVGLQEVDDDEVLDVVGLALDLKTPTLDSLATALSQRRALIVLDNCEHVLDGVADVIDHVTSHTDRCHVLTTSREGLAVVGEWVIPVPTLGDDDHGPGSRSGSRAVRAPVGRCRRLAHRATRRADT